MGHSLRFLRFPWRGPTRRLIVAVVGCSVLALVMACRPNLTDTPSDVNRLIESEPFGPYDRSAFIETNTVFSWRFAEPEDLDQWTYHCADASVYFGPRGMTVTPGFARWFSISREVSIEADQVDAIAILADGLLHQGATLEWCGAGEDYSVERRIDASPTEKDGGFRLIQILTRGHPLWRGRIERLRFGFFVPRNSPEAVIHTIKGMTERVLIGELENVVARPWRIALDGDLRLAMVSVPGTEATLWTLQVPEDAILEFSCGLESRCPLPTRIRVTASTRTRKTAILVDEVIHKADHWHNMKVDLSQYSNQRVTLRLGSIVAEKADPRLGMAAWANPVVYRTQVDDQPNLVMIVLDALRAENLSLYGYHRDTSPRIAAWAQEHGAVFENTVAPSPWTLPSHVSLFTGLDCARHGVNWGAVPPHLELLAERLRQDGYRTAAVTGGGYLHPQFGFFRGFEEYRAFDLRLAYENEFELGVKHAIELLSRFSNRPFFLFFHTYEVHNPFRKREPHYRLLKGRPFDGIVDVKHLPARANDGFRTRRTMVVRKHGRDQPDQPPIDEIADWAIDAHDSSIRYVDSGLQEVFDTLSALDLDEKTIVVLTSDHGEMFGEWGVYDHISLWDQNLLVPLVIAEPSGRGAGTRITSQVRLVDVMPTVLDLLGTDVPSDLDGVSLASLLDGEEKRPWSESLAWSYAASSNYGISLRVDNQFKYLFSNAAWESELPDEAFFDLRSGSEVVMTDPPSKSRVDQLRRLTESALESISGLRIQITNRRGDETLTGDLIGKSLRIDRVKILRAESPKLQRIKSGGRFRVEPGESLTIHVDPTNEPSSSLIAIELNPFGDCEQPFSSSVRVDEIDGFLQLRCSAYGWTANTVHDKVGDGIFLWSHADDNSSGADVHIEPALLEHLKALGYTTDGRHH